MPEGRAAAAKVVTALGILSFAAVGASSGSVIVTSGVVSAIEVKTRVDSVRTKDKSDAIDREVVAGS